MKRIQIKLILILTLCLVLIACKQGRNWSTTVYLEDVGDDTVRIQLIYDLQTNDGFQFVGYCWSTSQEPIPEGTEGVDYEEFQISATEDRIAYLTNLNADTKYYLRSFIYVDGEYKFSEEINFTTSPELATCEPPAGILFIEGYDYDATDFSSSHGEKFILESDYTYGNFKFTFNEKPTKSRIYNAVQYLSEFDTESVIAYSYLRLLFDGDCVFYANKDEPIYVNVDEAGEISVTLCETKYSTFGLCDDQLITGKMQE